MAVGKGKIAGGFLLAESLGNEERAVSPEVQMDDNSTTKDDISDLALIVGDLIVAIIGASTDDKEKTIKALESAVKLQTKIVERMKK